MSYTTHSQLSLDITVSFSPEMACTGLLHLNSSHIAFSGQRSRVSIACACKTSKALNLRVKTRAEKGRDDKR